MCGKITGQLPITQIYSFIDFNTGNYVFELASTFFPTDFCETLKTFNIITTVGGKLPFKNVFKIHRFSFKRNVSSTYLHFMFSIIC